MQKLARVVLGTNNVDCCARVCHAPSAAGLSAMLGTGAATSSFDDIEQRPDDPGVRVQHHREPPDRRRAHQAGGPARRAADRDRPSPRSSSPSYADVHLRPRPGTNVALLNAIAAAIVEDDLVDDELPRASGSTGSTTSATLRPRASPRSGSPATVRRRARRHPRRGPPLRHGHARDLVPRARRHRARAGHRRRHVPRQPRAAHRQPRPARRRASTRCAARTTCRAPRTWAASRRTCPATRPSPTARGRVGAVWGAEVPDTPGLDAMEMLDAAAAGRLHALVRRRAGTSLLTQPDANATRRALARPRRARRAGPVPQRDRPRAAPRSSSPPPPRSRRTARS